MRQEVPKRRAPKQTGGVANTGTMTAGGDIVGRDKIVHHYGPSEESCWLFSHKASGDYLKMRRRLASTGLRLLR
jgi:hypothetical protein